ncbi:MAG: DegT/DnrJ/EryC1/StrS family aminotransferase [Treponema sp.]|jgi:dTDP-4-amino-4,6-dideoxygalactose transaminase|nr:DegT/DnrJ/EryC1/StrS family aminotransferase [Treponema sp.]
MTDAENTGVPFFRPSLDTAEEKAVLSVLRSNWLTTGKEALAFEKEFSNFITLPAAEEKRTAEGLETSPILSIAVNSNTSGLTLALDACGIKEGTAVITTPYTFVSTAATAQKLGAEVCFADIEKDSYSISPENIEAILKKDRQHKIRAILPVHVGGNVCNMEAICFLGKKYGVKIIEDAAHSFPAPTNLGYAGTIGDAGVFSFYATKTITTGEGGMVCTRDPEIAKRMVSMRMHGMDRTTWDRYTSPKASWEYDIIDAGYKYNLPDILAAIGRVQLKKAQELYRKRKNIVAIYNEAFAKFDFVELPPTSVGNAWHLYMIRIIPQKLKINRDSFAKKLQQKGIGISVHFIPLFHFTYWKNTYPEFRSENFPNAEHKYQTSISLPLWPGMSENDVLRVIQAVKETGEQNHA